MPIIPTTPPDKPRGADAEAMRQQEHTDVDEAPEIDPRTGQPRDVVSIHDFAYHTVFDFDEGEELPSTGRFP